MVCLNDWDDELLARINIDPAVFSGRPTIRNTRWPVDLIARRLLSGDDPERLMRLHPGLTNEDLAACLLCARRMGLAGCGW